MGLDQYFLKVLNKPELGSVDIKFKGWEKREDKPSEIPFNELYYFRKHHDLQGWMKALYLDKGGQNPKFNLDSVELTLDDLAILKSDVISDGLPETSGFFFGHDNTEGYKDETLEAIRLCEESIISENARIYYFSWW